MAEYYANDFVTRDGNLKIYLLSNHSAVQKNDAFIIEYEGEILVVDGGMNGINETQKKLLELRKKYLTAHPELADSVTCKLKINWFASHFHKDHVLDFIHDIIPDPYIEIDNIYIPPETAYVLPHEGCELDGDKEFRPVLMDQLERYQHTCYTVHEAKFGKEHVYSFMSSTGSEHEVEFTVYPPTKDWGVGEGLAKIVNYYSNDNPYDTQAIWSLSNSNSQWLRVKFGENVFLFTGDTMKRTPSHHDEPLDEMTKAYREMIGEVDFIKYVHHGLYRDLAAELMLSYNADYYLFTGTLATAGDAMINFVSQTLKAINEKESNHEPLTEEDLETKCAAEAKIKALREKFLYGEKYDITLTCTHGTKYIAVDKKERTSECGHSTGFPSVVV